MKVLITSGGTRVPIDRVRHIGNMSRGTFGSRIALEMLRLNARSDGRPIEELHFLHAKGSRRPFGVEIDLAEIDDFHATVEELDHIHAEHDLIGGPLIQHEYGDFKEYDGMLCKLLIGIKPDLVILAAAVSDFLVTNYVDGKVRTGDGLTIELCPAEKLISMVKPNLPDCTLVGFKLLVDSTQDDLEAAARESIEKNRCDLVVANDLRDIKAGEHRVTLVRPNRTAVTIESNPDDPNNLARCVASRSVVIALGG